MKLSIQRQLAIRQAILPLGPLLFALVACLLSAQPAASQQKLEELRANYHAESDPVRRAKALTKLGDEKFAVLRRELAAENYEAAHRLARQYLEAVRSTSDALKASGRNAEKKPDGFKQLQMHVRGSTRRLSEAILSMPSDERAPFAEIRSELEKIDRELLSLLFPRQPGRR